MTNIFVPPDIVASIITYLRAHGFDARSRVPLERAPGMVRVQRTGGEPENRYQDRPVILIESWDEDQPSSFDLSRRLWAMFAALDREADLPGVTVHRIGPATMPIQFPDDYAPELDLHQFELEAHVRMEQMEVEA
ncbi:hypothetical protein M3D53_09445 [Dermabacter hominis]|uniref:hypothetical protein n=1 Tax=Dermabacter hominis TaxID=36740 RepID=UPI0021A6A6DF|nr:hypothetical protein [Dermabacter hominis]MCT2056845.1 hypothetical protein [Dermabacter hominis]MCT2084334.1 hypothetical protein [Dermabacter hominis]MCT2091987.1 hypothetical protein [Dermabacter hominis]MCT2190190.1 hypothetical protein [Dermabacter hominis]MCT2227887.1 hypothetical protein [Dermabacter hominis]